MHTIVLAEDHPRTRQVLRRILQDEEDFTLVGEAQNGVEACRLLSDLRPDVLVCDLVMPGLGGLALAEQLGRMSPRTRMVIVSNHIEPPYVREALSRGAGGYVDKLECSYCLAAAVRAVLKGEQYLSPSLSEERSHC